MNKHDNVRIRDMSEAPLGQFGQVVIDTNYQSTKAYLQTTNCQPDTPLPGSLLADWDKSKVYIKSNIYKM